MFPSAFTLYTVLVASIALAASMPTPHTEKTGPAYSGAGGQAPGGSVISNGTKFIEILSSEYTSDAYIDLALTLRDRQRW